MARKAVTPPNHYLVVLCGGTGPRLWPLSRASRPKQFLHVFGKKSLLQQTLDRLKSIAPPENILVVSNFKYKKLLLSETESYLPPKNIILEPDKKNTAMAIVYASSIISKIDPLATISTFPADHFISDPINFKKDILKAAKLAQTSNSIVTIGVKPTFPSTSYGYITVNKNHVTRFIEKPTLELAQDLINSQNTYWNSGIYTFKINTIVDEFKIHTPEYFKSFEKIISNTSSIKNIYSSSSSFAIDTAVSEKSSNLTMIPASFPWSDIGEWKSIYQQRSTNHNGIVALDPETKYIEVSSNRCLVSGPPNKLIGLVDVDDLAIIDTPDALLVCNIASDGSYKVRDLISKITSDPKLEHYFLSTHDH